MTDPYAAAWLAELWPVVREHHDYRSEPPKVTTRRKKTCPICGVEYAASNLSRHVNKMHAQPVDKAV